MTPESVAALFEDAALGQFLAALIGVAVVSLLVWLEWRASAPHRAQRSAWRRSQRRGTEDLF